MRNWKKQAVQLLLILSVCLLFCAMAQACPTCKEGLANSDPHHDRLVQGYFWSILFMMSMPFLILGGLGSYFYFEVRKARSKQYSPNGLPTQIGLASNIS